MEQKNVYIMKQPMLGKKIYDLRKRKGLTQEELVDRCNINVRTIQRIESGEVTPRSFTIKRILEVLEVEMNEIFITKEYAVEWSEKEKKDLNISWVSGIFLCISSLVAYLVEYFFFFQKEVPFNMVLARVMYSLFILISMYFFLNGYRTIAKKYNDSFLNTSVKTYFILTIITSLIMVSYSFISEDEFVVSAIMALVIVQIGISELFLGIGVLKLKEIYGAYPQIIGILKIINGAMMITVLLSIFGMFLLIPVLILEILLLYKIYQKGDLISVK